MFKLINYFKKNPFIFFITVIIVIAFVLRFYDYSNRFVLAPDQAGFAMQAKYSIDNAKIPMLGPFSSGAPFQTGGEWYWFVMLGYILIPFTIISPWIFLTLTSLIFVVFIIYVSKKIVDTKFALIVGLIAAISTAQINQSLNLTNQSPQALFSLMAFWFSYLLLKTKKAVYSLLMGLSIGLAASIHLQGGALASIFLITVLVGKIKSIRVYVYFFFGLVLPWIPVLFKDFQNNFYNTQNMVNYYLFNQNPISYEALGRRWLTFSFDFIPNAWANIASGHYILSFIIFILAGVIFIYLALKKKLKKEWIVIFGTTFISIIILRYTRTPIFDSYLVFLHPFVYFITGFVVYYCYRFNKLIGLIFLSILIILILNNNILSIKSSTLEKSNYKHFYYRLILEEPVEKINLYDFRYKNTLMTLPLAFYLYSDNKLSDKGRPIGMAIATSSANFNSKFKPLLNSEPGGFELYDLSGYTQEELSIYEWRIISPTKLYNVTQNWFKE